MRHPDIGSYRNLELLHDGPIATYAGVHASGRRVQLRAAAPGQDDPDVDDRLQRELELLSAGAPYLPRLVETLTHAGNPVVVTEERVGVGLRDLCARGPLDPAMWSTLAVDLMRLAEWTRARGIVLGTLGIDDVLRDEAGGWFVRRVGVAARVGSTVTLDRREVDPAALAPELWSIGEMKSAGDLYSIGTILFAAAVGLAELQRRLPHVYASTIPEAQREEQWVTLPRDAMASAVRPLTGPLARFAPLLQSLLSSDPERRARDGHDVVARLASSAFAAGTAAAAGSERPGPAAVPVFAARPTPAPSYAGRRAPVRGVIKLVCVGVVLLGLIAMLRARRHPTRASTPTHRVERVHDRAPPDRGDDRAPRARDGAPLRRARSIDSQRHP